MFNKKSLLAAGLFLLANLAAAQSSFQLSLVPDAAIVPRGENVQGLALNVWGENEANGVTLGLVNGFVGQSSGFSYSLIGTYGYNYRGVAWGGLVTYFEGEVRGWQAGLLNSNTGTLVGLQTGLINYATNARGLQWGFLNYTDYLHGVQIGLVNIVGTNPAFTALPEKLAPVFPFVNWSF